MEKDDFWIAYQSLPQEKRRAVESVLYPKRKKSVDDLLRHMEDKGITFQKASREEARGFLRNNNYYFKLAAYRANYAKRQRGKYAGQYLNLDFAYLKELSVIDMHLRYLILQMCLDIEHHVKLMLMRDIEENPDEDGYTLVEHFDPDKTKRAAILRKSKNSYAHDLICKYENFLNYPVWSLCELIDFGGLCALYKTYREMYPNREGLPKYSLLNPIRNLRNAAAHSNCLIYKLRATSQTNVSDIYRIVSSIPSIKRNARDQYLHIIPIHDFAVLLYWYSTYVKSSGLLRKRKKDLYSLFFNRMTRNAEYFKDNQYIQNAYLFCVRLVLHFFKNY